MYVFNEMTCRKQAARGYRATDAITGSFARYKFVNYLLTTHNMPTEISINDVGHQQYINAGLECWGIKNDALYWTACAVYLRMFCKSTQDFFEFLPHPNAIDSKVQRLLQ